MSGASSARPNTAVNRIPNLMLLGKGDLRRLDDDAEHLGREVIRVNSHDGR